MQVENLSYILYLLNLWHLFQREDILDVIYVDSFVFVGFCNLILIMIGLKISYTNYRKTCTVMGLLHYKTTQNTSGKQTLIQDALSSRQTIELADFLQI